ncbi:MAG: response regulator [Anaerolineales bacterium]
MSDIVILVIDSDETSRNLLAQLLRKRGYKVFTSPNGKDGIMRSNDYLPNVIIVDTALPDYGPVEFVQHFRRDPRFGLTPIIAISTQNDPDEMERCIKAGYNEYFGKSGMAALGVAESVPRLLAESANKQKKDDKGLLCVFLSAKGGVGTSSLCANVAQNLAFSMTQSTVGVLDLVLPMGSIASIVGADETFNVVEASLKSPAELTSDFFRKSLDSPQGWGFHLLPGSPNPDLASRLLAERIPDIVSGMRQAYNYLVIDFGRTLSRISMPIIQKAEAVALVLGTDVSSVQLTRRTLDYLLAQGVDRNRIYPILNRAVGLQGLSKSEAETQIGMEIRITVPYMMENFTLANNLHVPVATKFPTDTTSMILKQIAAEISQKAIKVHTGALRPA